MSRTDLKEHGSTIFCRRLQFPLTGFFFFFFHILTRHLDHMRGRFDLSPSACGFSVSGCLRLLAVRRQRAQTELV